MTGTKDKASKAGRAVRRRLKPQEAKDRGAVTLYLDKALYKAFREACEELNTAPSQVAEELLRAFLD